MYALEKIKKDIALEIKRAVKVELRTKDFILAPNVSLGDLSLPCFVMAKWLKTDPNSAAKQLAQKLNNKKWIAQAEAVGPYLNIKLDFSANALIIKDVLKNKDKYGFNKDGNKKRVMIEYSNANTHKEFHVGHLRNISFGDAVSKILAANGFKVIPVSYINDFGIHVAKTLWWLYHEHNTEAKNIIAKGVDNKGYFLGQQYTEASMRLAENEQAVAEVSEIMKSIEIRRGEIYKLWKKTRQWSIDQFTKVYKEMGIKFATTFYENEFLESGLKMVHLLKDKGILKESEGALIADLEKYGLGILVILRKDGTALYPVADLSLAVQKIKRYKLDSSLYVVDMRQSLYFKQLFKLLENLGFKTKFEHLPYDFVKLPTGMMSSRTGNIVPYEDLKNLALEKAKEEIKSRHNDWSLKQINQVANALALGALKFEMIKVSSEKQITFDMNNALRFDGFTAAYLQYTYARLRSINRKAEKNSIKADCALLREDKEKDLLMKAAFYPEIVKLAGDKKDPAEIAKYIFEFSQSINDYYHAVPVLKADKATGAARLMLLEAAALVIKQGLSLLGIETVEEM